eukprot:gb/GECH01008045.1/.p1 GENE.gb/GECH01008045.1/~~gb/GECH01008045.1/.p1  ORF type:complete len:399 (+),score=72.31 gb/GECH01008045.1/:1-1197(+)
MVALKFKVDMEKSILRNNFERRGFVKTNDDDWNVYWAGVQTVRQIFYPDSGFRLTEGQVINHFPNHYELTRKDLMIKNIKRYRKDIDKEVAMGNIPASQGRTEDNETVADFVPTTFTLPADYSLFVEEYKKNPSSKWIMKPSGKARGIGIFIVTKLSQLRKWAKDKIHHMTNRDQYVISRYIDDPLLIGGKKFDLRLYVLVLSYRPLRAFLYREGFSRFCNAKYTNDMSELDNLYVHLTNVSIQKHGEDYNESHGGKWNIRNLLLYLESTRGKEAADKLFRNMKFIMIHALKACKNAIINDKHCFECYGFDIIIDDNLKPWLIEVNASPSMSYTTRADRIMKNSLVSDILDIVIPPNFPDRDAMYDLTGRLGKFEVLHDEAPQAAAERRKRLGKSSKT